MPTERRTTPAVIVGAVASVSLRLPASTRPSRSPWDLKRLRAEGLPVQGSLRKPLGRENSLPEDAVDRSHGVTIAVKRVQILQARRMKFFAGTNLIPCNRDSTARPVTHLVAWE